MFIKVTEIVMVRASNALQKTSRPYLLNLDQVISFASQPDDQSSVLTTNGTVSYLEESLSDIQDLVHRASLLAL